MLLSRTVAPAALLTDAEVKAHLRIDHAYDDAAVTAARVVAEIQLDGRDGYLRRALVTQTWEWKLSRFPAGKEIHFPFPPLQSVTAVAYRDVAGDVQTMDAASYRVHPEAHVGYLRLKPTGYWPATDEADDAVTITFVAGYGAPADVPRPIRQAALLRAGALYTTRGDAEETGLHIADKAFSATEYRLLSPYRITEMVGSYEQYWRETRTRPY